MFSSSPINHLVATGSRQYQTQYLVNRPRSHRHSWPATTKKPTQSFSSHGAVSLALATASSVPLEPYGKSTRLDQQSAPEALKVIDTVVLDCDGVLWRGSELVHNSIQIVSSSYAVAAYLKSLGISKKVFLIGQQGVEQELQQIGIQYIGGEQFELPLLPDVGSMKALQVDPDIGAVVVAWDPAFSYSKLVYASICLRELPGCILVVSNTDSGDNIGDGRMMPGTGAIAAAVQIASGATPIVVGKGGPWLLPFLCQSYGLEPSRAAIVGDRLDTDIALGKQGGMRTFLPLTGVATLEDVARADPSEVPDYVMPSIATLAGLPSS